MSMRLILITLLSSLLCTMAYGRLPVDKENSDEILLAFQKLKWEEDEHEVEYQLEVLSKEWCALLEDEHTSFLLADTLLMKKETSLDGKYTLFMFPITFKNGITRVDWYVVYGEINKKKAYHFKEEFFKQKGKSHQHPKAPKVRIDIAIQEFNGENFYSARFYDENNPLVLQEVIDIDLKCWFEEIGEATSDEVKLAINDNIHRKMMILWNEKELFKNRFKGLKRVSTILSKDGKVKISTWNVEKRDGTSEFFGCVVYNPEGVELYAFPLTDYSYKVRSPSQASLTHKKWYGVMYYDIIEVPGRNNSTYYTLLGYRSVDEMVKMRLIDLLWFPSNSTVQFGYPIFVNGKSVEKRSVFEYSASVNMMLRYDKTEEMIVMDHLEPYDPNYRNNPRFLGPDFSYDGYKFEKGRWVLYNNLDLRNPKQRESIK